MPTFMVSCEIMLIAMSFGLAPGPLKKGSFNTYCCWEVKGWEGVLTTLVVTIYIQCHARQTLLSNKLEYSNYLALCNSKKSRPTL